MASILPKLFLIIFIIIILISGLNRFEKEIDAIGIYSTKKEKEIFIKGSIIFIICFVLYPHRLHS